MTIQAQTLRPGFLVSLKTSLRGNVSYVKQTIEGPHIDNGAEKERWETERTVTDPQEHERAVKARSKACGIIRSVCAASAFGLLCPEAKAAELEQAIADARDIENKFNASASVTRLQLFVLSGRVAADDVEAVKSIKSEIRDLMEDMARGLQTLDVKQVRDAANKAKSIGSMLTPQAQARVQEAIDAARASARQIVKAGEQAAQEIDTLTIRKITEARTAFLDLDQEQTEIAAPAPVAPAVEFNPMETDTTDTSALAAEERRYDLPDETGLTYPWDAEKIDKLASPAQPSFFSLDL